jgi:hypothetical protein
LRPQQVAALLPTRKSGKSFRRRQSEKITFGQRSQFRELVETVRSNHVETGIVLGRQNRRGVTSRLPRDGGKQERDLVALYRKYSKSTALEWPRTSAVLERIASAFEEFGRWHDEDAERLDW